MTQPDPASLTHRLEGEGPPVLLLNGGMMSYPGWEKVAATLRDRYRLLLFDFRGQLLSPGQAPASLEGHVDDVIALLDAVGWPTCHFVGTSFGALVSVALAARHPERVASLALITAMDHATPAFDAESREMREILESIAAGGDRGPFYDLLTTRVYSASYRQAEAASLAARRKDVERMPASWFEGVDRLLAAIEGFDLRPLLAEIRCPSLVVIAGEDRVMPAHNAMALAEALGAEVREHPAAGHALVAEDPRWLADVCLEFLAARRHPR